MEDAGHRPEDIRSICYVHRREIVMVGNLVYLGALSCIDIWSSVFLLKSAFIMLNNTDTTPESNSYKIMKEIVYSGVLRIIFINLIPLVRLIVSFAVTSSFNYENDTSIVVYLFQVSM